MSGLFSMIEHVVFDLPVRWGDVAFLYASKFSCDLALSPEELIWLEHLCHYVGFRLVFLLFNMLIALTLTVARKVWEFRSQPALDKAKAGEIMEKAKAEKVAPPDNHAKSEIVQLASMIPQVLDPQNRLAVGFETHDGQFIRLDLYVTAGRDGKPVLHNFCSAKQSRA